MRVSELFETTEEDHILISLARKLYDKITLELSSDPRFAGKTELELGDIGNLLDLNSDNLLYQFLLNINFRVQPRGSFSAAGSTRPNGMWSAPENTIYIARDSNGMNPRTIAHELRHAVDSYKSGGKHNMNKDKRKWADRPSERSAEYAAALNILHSVKYSGRDPDALIKFAIGTMKTTAPAVGSPEYRNLVSRMYRYLTSSPDYETSDKHLQRGAKDVGIDWDEDTEAVAYGYLDPRKFDFLGKYGVSSMGELEDMYSDPEDYDLDDPDELENDFEILLFGRGYVYIYEMNKEDGYASCNVGGQPIIVPLVCLSNIKMKARS